MSNRIQTVLVPLGSPKFQFGPGEYLDQDVEIDVGFYDDPLDRDSFVSIFGADTFTESIAFQVGVFAESTPFARPGSLLGLGTFLDPRFDLQRAALILRDDRFGELIFSSSDPSWVFPVEDGSILVANIEIDGLYPENGGEMLFGTESNVRVGWVGDTFIIVPEPSVGLLAGLGVLGLLVRRSRRS